MEEASKSQHSASGIPFSLPGRPAELAAGVYRTIARKKRLFIQAPTGVGKTISTVFPAVKAVGEDLGDRIFYLTAKTVTRTVAEEAFRVLRGKGLRMKTVTLTAKEKLCVCEEVQCNPDSCPYAKGHFDRVNGAVYELLTEGPDELGREVLLAQAHKHRVCPFELSLDTASWTDAVICDYNYVFDPNVRLKRFFAEGTGRIPVSHRRGPQSGGAGTGDVQRLSVQGGFPGAEAETERAVQKGGALSGALQ